MLTSSFQRAQVSRWYYDYFLFFLTVSHYLEEVSQDLRESFPRAMTIFGSPNFAPGPILGENFGPTLFSLGLLIQ